MSTSAVPEEIPALLAGQLLLDRLLGAGEARFFDAKLERILQLLSAQSLLPGLVEAGRAPGVRTARCVARFCRGRRGIRCCGTGARCGRWRRRRSIVRGRRRLLGWRRGLLLLGDGGGREARSEKHRDDETHDQYLLLTGLSADYHGRDARHNKMPIKGNSVTPAGSWDSTRRCKRRSRCFVPPVIDDAAMPGRRRSCRLPPVQSCEPACPRLYGRDFGCVAQRKSTTLTW